MLQDLLFISSIFQSGTARKSVFRQTTGWVNSTGKLAKLWYMTVPAVIIVGA